MDELLPAARDLMTQDFLTVEPSLGLLGAVQVLDGKAQDTALVVDAESRLVGLLSELDCLRTLAARAYDSAIAETVRDVISSPPPTLAPDADVYAVAGALERCACSTLPVVADGRVVGVVTRIAVLRALLEIFRHRTDALGEVERTADDLRERPESKEQMQRVAANLDRDQLTSLFSQTVHKDE